MITVSLMLMPLLAVLATGLLIVARKRWQQDDDKLLTAINQLLPQTQCAQCGFPGCRPYAKAIAEGAAAINLCPPGGDQTVERLANLLGADVIQLAQPAPDPVIASIREPECIGCTLCIQACPVDAIIGANQQMHVVLEDQCTGCELCLPPCPVDCIDLKPLERELPIPLPDYSKPCIHCGLCADACPKSLAPQQLLLHSHEAVFPDALRLDECVECLLCDRVCPAEIPLTLTFKSMKSSKRLHERESAEANMAEYRYQQHEDRIAKEQQTVKKRPTKPAKSLLADIAQDLSP